jgi:methyl-accepting chemotaxis protein
MRGEDGVERLHTFARVGAPTLSDYTVTIGIPTETILSAARRDQLMSLLGLAATTMLAMLAAWLVGDVLIVQRVRKLMGTAERIAAGDLEARSGIDYGSEEIGNLAQALDRMAAALQKKETGALAGRTRAARGRPAQGRIPGDAGARTEEPAGADQHRRSPAQAAALG